MRGVRQDWGSRHPLPPPPFGPMPGPGGPTLTHSPCPVSPHPRCCHPPAQDSRTWGQPLPHHHPNPLPKSPPHFQPSRTSTPPQPPLLGGTVTDQAGALLSPTGATASPMGAMAQLLPRCRVRAKPLLPPKVNHSHVGQTTLNKIGGGGGKKPLPTTTKTPNPARQSMTITRDTHRVPTPRHLPPLAPLSREGGGPHSLQRRCKCFSARVLPLEPCTGGSPCSWGAPSPRKGWVQLHGPPWAWGGGGEMCCSPVAFTAPLPRVQGLEQGVGGLPPSPAARDRLAVAVT